MVSKVTTNRGWSLGMEGPIRASAGPTLERRRRGEGAHAGSQLSAAPECGGAKCLTPRLRRVVPSGGWPRMQMAEEAAADRIMHQFHSPMVLDVEASRDAAKAAGRLRLAQ